MSACPTCGQALPDEAGQVRMTGEFAVVTPAQLAKIAAESGQDPFPAEHGDPASPPGTLPHADGESCSWCGKPATAVRKLLTGKGVQICDGCVALCYMILRDELEGFGG